MSSFWTSSACFAALLLAAPAAHAQQSPRTAEEELATFKLPAGYSIELVASDPDIAKVVDIAFDDAGRMWACTAVEYPVDGNETADAAELYRRGGKDRVLVFDTPTASGRQTPRTFADGLAIPLTVLPIAGGVLVGMGPQILFMKDTDGDGRADQREVVLDGFGVQDSHLMPHRLLRGPGEWIYVAQGAFNESRVRTKSGEVVPFDQCKLGRFRLDGSRFEVVATGLNNIWGMVIDRRGEMYIQEANDMGYPVVPLYVGASYPGIGDHRAHPYSPWQPALADFEMGGTGLSGLALSEDPNGFPAPYDGVFFVANPIARSLQAIRVIVDGELHRLTKLPDFLTSSDEWFRPVAIHFGPDGCLYVVDWYNQVISHNEVPRNDPHRDKTRGRIWRVRHESMQRREIPDLTRLSNAELPPHLLSDSTWEARAAWHQIVDRQARELAQDLGGLLLRKKTPQHVRMLAMWSLEGMKLAARTVSSLQLKDKDRALRREAIFALDEEGYKALDLYAGVRSLAADPDAQVRQAVIHSIDALSEPSAQALGLLVAMVQPHIDEQAPSGDAAADIAARERRGLREFERSLIRAALEGHADMLEAFLGSNVAFQMPDENIALACLALPPEKGAPRLAKLLPTLGRAPDAEEFALLARFADDPAVAPAVAALLEDPARQAATLALCLEARAPLQGSPLCARIADAARANAARSNDAHGRQLLLRLAAALRIAELAPDVAAQARAAATDDERLACARALVEIGSGELELLHDFAAAAPTGGELQRVCVAGIAGAKDARAAALLADLWPALSEPLRKSALRGLSGTKEGAGGLLQALADEEIADSELDGETLERLAALLPGDPRLARVQRDLEGRLRPVLALAGGDEDWVDTDLALAGPFTVECWVKLDEPISNADGILGVPGGADFNFADGRFRLYGGPAAGDWIIAQKRVAPGAWTHVALTRAADGTLAVYLNGERDEANGKAPMTRLEGLDVGRTTPGEGTHGELAEMRVWDVARSPTEIGADFRRTFEGEPRPEHLLYYAPGAGPWGKLSGAARVVRENDAPALLSGEAARALEARFAAWRKVVDAANTAGPGDAARGREVFVQTCGSCHAVHGEGGAIGPNLDGAGRMGTDALLRATLTPSAAVEPGYRLLRVQTRAGELLDGMLASQDATAIVLRRQGREDLRIPRADLERIAFDRLSVMPDGLIDSLKPEDARALFAYLATLR